LRKTCDTTLYFLVPRVKVIDLILKADWVASVSGKIVQMKALALGGLMAGFLALPAAAEDCTLPEVPTHIPNGTTATREDMLAAIQALKAFEAGVKAFQECANRSNDAAQMHRADKAVDSVRFIADKFNYELQAFKRRSGG
jgi:hypothetical protein